MKAKETPNYVTFTAAENDYGNYIETIAQIICPICHVQIRRHFRFPKIYKENEPDRVKHNLAYETQHLLLKHLEDHYHNGAWGNFDGQPQIYDDFQPKTPTRWQRIKWALTGKKNKEELWVI